MTEYHTPTLQQRNQVSVPGPDGGQPATVRCFVCHRRLRDPVSIARGCGKTCAENVGLLDHHRSSEESSDIVPLFPLPSPAARRVTIHAKPYRRPRVTCDICHRRRNVREIHPVSLGDDPAIMAACEPCISAIVRYGEKPVREYLADRPRARKAAS